MKASTFGRIRLDIPEGYRKVLSSTGYARIRRPFPFFSLLFSQLYFLSLPRLASYLRQWFFTWNLYVIIEYNFYINYVIKGITDCPAVGTETLSPSLWLAILCVCITYRPTLLPRSSCPPLFIHARSLLFSHLDLISRPPPSCSWVTCSTSLRTTRPCGCCKLFGHLRYFFFQVDKNKWA